MAKIALIQNFAYEYLGILYIEGVLSNAGHRVQLFLDLGNQRQLIKDLASFAPDLVGLTVTTTAKGWALDLAVAINQTVKTKIILGGPHPTYFPEVIHEPSISIICRGEGEFAMLELANKIDRAEDLTDTGSCWFKVGNSVIKNEQTPLIEELDRLSFPNRDSYYRKYPFLNVSRKSFMATRGCPFSCSYCYNHGLKKLYEGKGKYVRRRSVDNIIEEIRQVLVRYRLRTVYMQDDTFILEEQWVGEFMKQYRQEIKRPLICLIRADLTNEPLIARLAEGGCKAVFFGIETGDEILRNRLLKKEIRDEQIYTSAKLLKRYGIKFRTYNMVGLPDETLTQMWKTVMINIDIKTPYPWCAIFQPFAGTELGDYAREYGFVEDKNVQESTSYFQITPLKSAYKNELINLQKLFFYAVKFPKLFPLIKKIVKVRPNPVFNVLFLMSYGWCYYKSENLLFKEMISIGLRNFKSLFNIRQFWRE
ncbi:MAG: radical SAM protein [Candidatus Omnitrophota bacterium]